ncbi:MAG: recombinase family protein, partial [Rubrobacteridae bacterium]|nr:recombinase family protein [Rubrobacteridae bacterium]
EAFKMYSTGLYSLTQLHEKITNMGLITRPTRKWSEQPISRSTLALVLQNKFYTGYFDWKDVEYKGNHEALIDLDTFQKVQDLIRLHRVGNKRRKYNHFLKGTVCCADCGRKLSIDATKKKNMTYLFYYCLGKKNKTKCTYPYLNVEKIEKGVENYYSGIKMKDEWIEKIIDDFKHEMLARESEDYRQRKLAHKRIEKLQKEKVRLTKAYMAEAMDIDVLKAENERINKGLAEAHKLSRTTFNDSYQNS